MQVIPAIDLRAGRCVRLVQGDYDRETIFDEDPIAVALRWQSAGARRIHVVDLDGARSGNAAQHDLVIAIAEACKVPIQVGGGIRSFDDAGVLLEAGIDRVILGTAAVKDPELISTLITTFGAASVVAGIDARAGHVATDGWIETSAVPALELIDDMRARGIERVVYTDIERDGTLTEPNYAELARVAASGVRVIASGGVALPEHLDRIAEIDGVESVIVGRALYSGEIALERDEWDWRVDGSAA
jgi:phosphoribosylformimino-5-aminoimidazole carboxamide ribotide isomerase